MVSESKVFGKKHLWDSYTLWYLPTPALSITSHYHSTWMNNLQWISNVPFLCDSITPFIIHSV